ncbi:hypothetical protein L6164_036342 [Bauhinia variegata]|uniref:Uncharacterized protein n=1 Tax=Bauhinia variegata TaxID=167791 RepID=A0ACB9KGM7_BAUVA|nr:hypothetical protein L6164_036342 [Bauhinia variegata]
MQSHLKFVTAFEKSAIINIKESNNRDVETEEKGIFLTWKDLWVTVPNGRNGRKPILQGLTGYAKPGQLLAIMGPSGCGKSTLLDALAGRLDSNTKQTGKILVNGRRQELAYGTSAYVTQDDAMLSNLTAGEAVYYSAQLQFPDSMSKAEKKERADITIREMGLQDAIDTRIGGWGSKGLSGGQKRRLGICIEILTRPRLLFLDEPTSGLDAAASYYVMSRIASLNQRDGIQRTIVAAIHQPSSEVFELFHDLCLLSSGETVYFGPASAANEFFSSNGFPCPALHNPADHFLRIINKDFKQDSEEGLDGGLIKEEAVNILVKSYACSKFSDQVKKEVEEIGKNNSGAMEKKRTHAAFSTQCLVLTRRSLLQMYRDISNYWLRLFLYGATAISIGTIFYHLGSSSGSIQARGSLLCFTTLVLTFITFIGGFPPLVEIMKAYERERLNGHYGVTAFTIGNTLSAVPYILLTSIIPGVAPYFLSGLQKGLGHFLYFSWVQFANVFWVESLIIVSIGIVPKPLMGMLLGMGVIGLMSLLGGFYRLPNDLPTIFWRYPLHYICFHKYAFQGLFKNEFGGLEFVQGNKTMTGREILTNMWQVEIGYSKWVDLAILFGMIVLYRGLFLGITKSKEKLKHITAAIR